MRWRALRFVLGAVVVLGAVACTADRPPPLSALERGAGEGPVLVLLHGYGSRPEHLVSFAERTDLGAGTRVVLPYAPSPIERGFMWWPLPADLHDLRRASMPGMGAARERVRAFLDGVQERFGVPSERVVLGGFSQGAMLALDVALHDPRPLGGVVFMSGTIVGEDDWRARIATRRGLRVYASHGRADRVLPYEHAEHLVSLLREGGLDVRFRGFDGDHVVTDEVSTDVAAFVRETPR